MLSLSLNDLLDDTDWERQKWHEWPQQRGDQVLKTSAGPHGGELRREPDKASST